MIHVVGDCCNITVIVIVISTIVIAIVIVVLVAIVTSTYFLYTSLLADMVVD